MSIYRCSGLVRKPSGLIHEIIHQLKVVDLRPVQRIEYKFDPFHQSAKHVRDLSFWLSSPKIRDTNFKCVFKTSVLSNLSPPEIHCKLGKAPQFYSKLVYYWIFLTHIINIMLQITGKNWFSKRKICLYWKFWKSLTRLYTPCYLLLKWLQLL